MLYHSLDTSPEGVFVSSIERTDIMRNEAFNLSKPLLTLLEQHGITTPTQVQQEIIPAIEEGRDVLAQSETGSGKTLSFALPMIERTNRRDGLTTLVLVPTRELCLQVAGEFVKFSAGKHLGIVEVYGGVSIQNQINKLRTANIIVATPGRLIDLLDRRAVRLETVKHLVLDEADRMLDMGFIRDIERILEHMKQKRQTMLFSATVTKEIQQLSQRFLTNPKHVQLASSVKPEYLQQTYYQTTSEQKLPLLIALLKRERDLALIFCNRKHIASRLARRLTTQGVQARSLHGDMSQAQRERTTSEFRNKRFKILVATDVAARGLHIEGITHVYNYEIPKDVESYTHRVGRTARAGKEGEAISLVAGPEEQKFFKQILFTFSGRISLRTMMDVPPLSVPEVKKERPRESSRPKHRPSSGNQRSRKQGNFKGRKSNNPPPKDESAPNSSKKSGKWKSAWQTLLRK
jgi:ATP-dependent RNA helicase DeaD